MSNNNKIELLEGLVNAAIPEVYAKGMSYYEVLTAVVNKLNEVINQSNEYFSTEIIDFVEEILIKWKDDGTLESMIDDILFSIGDLSELETNWKDSLVHSINWLVQEIENRHTVQDPIDVTQFMNTWTGSPKITFYKHDERVYLQGTLSGGAGGTLSGVPAFQLPATYRPSKSVNILVNSAPSRNAVIEITPSGLVTPQWADVGMSVYAVTLDGLSFDVR